jgi:hypothetical protein
MATVQPWRDIEHGSSGGSVVGDHAAMEKPFVSVAPIRWQQRRVAEWVELLYATLSYSDDEIVEALRGGGHNPYRAH